MNATNSARPLVILLGASNLTRGMPTVIGTLQRMLDAPLRIVAAYGYGRSYGLRSRVLVRELPPILECGVWNAIQENPPSGGFALVTDIGNDIIYGQNIDAIVRWVETCLDRLDLIGARTIVTQLPIESIRALSPRRFEILRRVLYPSHALRFEEALFKAEALNEAIVELARSRRLAAVPFRPEWYGFDPIHIRPRRQRAAWRSILQEWARGDPAPDPRWSPSQWLSLRMARPAYRWMFGREQRRQQPACRFRDGTTFSVY